MPTSLRNFQTALENLYANKFMDVLKTCQNKFPDSTVNQLNSTVCLTRTGPNKYNDANGVSLDIPDSSTGLLVNGTLTYSAIMSKAYAAANYTQSSAEYIKDLTDIHTSLASTKFTTGHDATINLYTHMKSTRKDLDNKMRSLYGDGYTDNQTQNDNVVVVNLTLTVLATCVLYFLFVKL